MNRHILRSPWHPAKPTQQFYLRKRAPLCHSPSPRTPDSLSSPCKYKLKTKGTTEPEDKWSDQKIKSEVPFPETAHVPEGRSPKIPSRNYKFRIAAGRPGSSRDSTGKWASPFLMGHSHWGPNAKPQRDMLQSGRTVVHGLY